jgi:hypothetical protein
MGPGPKPPSHVALAAKWVPVQLAVLLGYLVAGAAVSWPRPSYLAGRLPATVDQSIYVWDFWWIAHQVTHLGNPWFTSKMAAPVGVQLGFDTLMPLPGLVMTPITLAFGPSASYNLLTILLPGLACYTAYRAARLWQSSQLGAVAAGGLYGLSTMLVWQDWYHINIAAGAVFLPLALETAVLLRRRATPRQAVVLGLVLGGSLLVNQESAIMAVIVAALALLPWLLHGQRTRALWLTCLAAAAAVLISGPQIAAMVQQARAGGAAVPGNLLARYDTTFGVPVTSLFAPSPRVSDFGLTTVGSLFDYQDVREGVPTFGVMLTVLGILGLVVTWRRASARLLGLLWAASAILALGTALVIGQHRFIPLPMRWHGVRMSAVLPYTWIIHLPGLSGFREADRFALLGLLPAALLAGKAVEWLSHRARVLLAAALALAALELGFSGASYIQAMPTAIPRLDSPVAADHSGSIVVDVPYGLRGGVAFTGKGLTPGALVLATADGHPRAVSESSWVPADTAAAIRGHAFYRELMAAQRNARITVAQLRSARQDAAAMRVGWAIVWKPTGATVRYLIRTGFTYRYRAGLIRVYRSSVQH